MTKIRDPLTIEHILSKVINKLDENEVKNITNKSISHFRKCSDPDDKDHNLHYADGFIKNIRVENHCDVEEHLTILNRATHSSGTTAKATTNLGAIATHKGAGEVFIYALGGPDDAGKFGKFTAYAESQGDSAPAEANIHTHV